MTLEKETGSVNVAADLKDSGWFRLIRVTLDQQQQTSR